MAFVPKGLSSSDFNCCSNENARKCEDAQDKPACGDTSRLNSVSDLNNNSVQITASELVASTTEPSERKDKSMAEKEQKVEEVSGNNKEERCGTTLNKQVTLVAKSGQEKESHKDASALASKCEQLNILYEIYIFSILF